MEEKKRKLNTLDKYIIFCFAFITIYTIAHTIIFAVTGQEATTLSRLVFSVIGLEILYCFLIKRFKLHDEAKIIKKKDDLGEEEDGYI